VLAYIPVWSCVGLESDFGLCLFADLCGLEWACCVVWACRLVWPCVDLKFSKGLFGLAE
jgi:hypothetical protein